MPRVPETQADTHSSAAHRPRPTPRLADSGRVRVIVFSRYPEPGKTKTRLIPALGAVGAARLQEQLTRHTLASADRFRGRSGCDLEVRFYGGTEKEMAAMFGEAFFYRTQEGMTLGDKLTNAIESAFQEGCKRLLVIGSDCPGIRPKHLASAIDLLADRDVIVGPAIDGGYYLIGMKEAQSQLFQNIDWGGPDVLRQTLAIATRTGLCSERLPPLPDVDDPEDLIQCRREGASFTAALPRTRPGMVSVIIPTLNEERRIADTIDGLAGHQNVETIVADGGSCDRTCEIAERMGARVIRGNPGRGTQMNAGAAIASGEVLIFLHADTHLPRGFPDIAIKVAHGEASAAAFRLRVDAKSVRLRLLERAVALRSRWFQRPYGDQGLIVPAKHFFYIGGFRNWPLMEDYEIADRLKKIGPIRLLDQSSTTSSRRWERLGVCRNVLYNQICIGAYKLGVCPRRLSIWYSRRTNTVRQKSNAAVD